VPGGDCRSGDEEQAGRAAGLSPKGTVPVLDTGDGVLEESLDIMRWALPSMTRRIGACWPTRRRRERADALIARNDSTFKAQVNLYKYAERYPEHSREHYRQQAEAWLVELESLLESGLPAGRPRAWPMPLCCP
jgi:glutathione S-transferase